MRVCARARVRAAAMAVYVCVCVCIEGGTVMLFWSAKVMWNSICMVSADLCFTLDCVQRRYTGHRLVAAQANHLEILQCLIDHNADVNQLTTDDDHTSPL